MIAGSAAREQYSRDAILSATPARLVTMLYDRLLLDLERAKEAQHAGDWATASELLLHAQAILAELMSSLKVEEWDGAGGLMALYDYAFATLVAANTHRQVERTCEGIAILEPLRQAWHEAAAALPAPEASATLPKGELGVA